MAFEHRSRRGSLGMYESSSVKRYRRRLLENDVHRQFSAGFIQRQLELCKCSQLNEECKYEVVVSVYGNIKTFYFHVTCLAIEKQVELVPIIANPIHTTVKCKTE